MNDSVRHRLHTLQQNGDLAALETYCKEFLLSEEDALVRGCLLWNLSDTYAMMRNPDALCRNHRQFEAHVQVLPPMYRLWLVSDGTQRLTLELGGYDDFWWSIYEDATTNYNIACEAALFEAHRAAFYKSPKIPYDNGRAVWVNNRFASFLNSACGSPSVAFYRLIYTALYLKHFGKTEQDIITCCEAFFDDLRSPAKEALYAAGEWNAINRRRSRQSQAQVGINNAVNTLIDIGDTQSARKLYAVARQYGLTANYYIESRI